MRTDVVWNYSSYLFGRRENAFQAKQKMHLMHLKWVVVPIVIHLYSGSYSLSMCLLWYVLLHYVGYMGFHGLFWYSNNVSSTGWTEEPSQWEKWIDSSPYLPRIPNIWVESRLIQLSWPTRVSFASKQPNMDNCFSTSMQYTKASCSSPIFLQNEGL